MNLFIKVDRAGPAGTVQTGQGNNTEKNSSSERKEQSLLEMMGLLCQHKVISVDINCVCASRHSQHSCCDKDSVRELRFLL